VVAGTTSKPVYRAICTDALRRPSVLVVTASSGRLVAGAAIAIVDWSAYWRTFPWRHPLAALCVATRRLRRHLRWPHKQTRVGRTPGYGEQLHDLVGTDNTNLLWRDSSPSIAKIVYIVTRSDMRNRGVGRSLYYFLFRELQAQGVTRVDANIDGDNLPSIKMHAHAGWTLHRTHSGVMAVYRLE